MRSLPPLRDAPLLVWGEPTLVTSLQLTAPLARDTSLTASSSTRHVGGSALAAAVGVLDADRVAARSPNPPRLWGPFADDPEGAWITAELRAVSLALHPLLAHHSRHSVALVDPDGARTIVGVPGDAFERPYADALTLSHLREASLLHCSIASVLKDPTGALVALLARVAQAALPWTLDLGVPELLRSRRDELDALLEAHPPAVVFANEAEAAAAGLLPHTPRSLDSILVCKRGPAPTHCYDLSSGELICEQAPPRLDPADVVDTTGAGDALAGGFLASWRAGGGLVDALTEGQRLAARVVQRTGTTLTL